jgi:hypothetical protein
MTVSELAGHTSTTTTAQYDHRGEAAKRAALLKMTIPHVRQHAVAQPEHSCGMKILTLTFDQRRCRQEYPDRPSGGRGGTVRGWTCGHRRLRPARQPGPVVE